MIDNNIDIENINENCLNDKNCSLEIVSYQYGHGNTHFISQCKTCGRLVHKMIAKSKIINPSKVKPFDKQKLENYEAKVKKLATEKDKGFEYYKWSLKLHQENRKLIYEKLFNEPYVDFDTSYEKYINYEAWFEKRKVILIRDNHLCRLCKVKKANQVHHISYRNLCSESDLELISVCPDCHMNIHNIAKESTRYDEMSP